MDNHPCVTAGRQRWAREGLEGSPTNFRGGSEAAVSARDILPDQSPCAASNERADGWYFGSTCMGLGRANAESLAYFRHEPRFLGRLAHEQKEMPVHQTTDRNLPTRPARRSMPPFRCFHSISDAFLRGFRERQSFRRRLPCIYHTTVGSD